MSRRTTPVADATRARSFHRLHVVMFALAAIGCTPRAISSPLRGLPVDSPRVLSGGEVGAGAEGGGEGALFGPEPSWVSGRMRVGAGRGVEIDAQGTYARGGFDPRYGVSPHMGAGRVGARVELAPGILTLAGGAAAGGGPLGPMLAADLGLVLGWENRIVVPFLAASAFVSEPLSDAGVAIITTNSDGTRGMTLLPTSRSAGLHASLGFRVPLQTDDPNTRVSLVGVFGITQLWGLELEGTPGIGLVGGAAAVEVTFDALGANARAASAAAETEAAALEAIE